MLAMSAGASAVCVLVNLGATVVGLCALFVAAVGLCLWALGRSEAETPVDVLTACGGGTLGCILAALWHLRDVLASLFSVSFCLFHMVLILHVGSVKDDDVDEGLEEEVGQESRGRPSAGTRGRLVRRTPRSPTARETTAEQARNMAPVLRETGGIDSSRQPGMGRSAVSRERALQGPDASRRRSASLSRSTWPRWNLRDAVLVSLSRKDSGPSRGARRSSKDPTGQRRRSVPAGRSRRVIVSSGSLFYENVVLRQVRELDYPLG